MIELRFHGRGGQGVVTAADLVAIAAPEMETTHRHFQFLDQSEEALQWLLLLAKGAL